ncbi:MAG: sigma factor-like helix-turn-helix DNA-binding protein, partial [Planctomycetota bacterium]
ANERPLPHDTVLSLDPPRGEAVKRPSQDAQEREGEAWIRLGLELLDPENREVVILRQWEGKTFPEIGGTLNITTEAATMRYKRAVERLAEKVGELRRRNLSSILEESAT